MQTYVIYEKQKNNNLKYLASHFAKDAKTAKQLFYNKIEYEQSKKPSLVVLPLSFLENDYTDFSNLAKKYEVESYLVFKRDNNKFFFLLET